MNAWVRGVLLISLVALIGQGALAAEKPLTNEDVIRMVKAGLSQELVEQRIKTAPSGFIMDTDAMIMLKEAEVPDTIMHLMLERQIATQRSVRSKIEMQIQSLATGLPEQKRSAYLFLRTQGAMALPQLRDALTSSRPEIRSAAAEVIGRLRDKKAAPLLRELLKDKSRDVRFQAANALSELRDELALDIAHKAVAAGAEPLDGYLRLVGHRRDLDSVGFASMRLLKEPEPLTREQAAWALGEIGSARACDALEDAMLLDPDDNVKRAAAEALGKIHAERSYRKLVEACKKHPTIRRDALHAISQFPPSQSVEFLIIALGQKLAPEEQDTVLKGLRRLTSRDFGDDIGRWNQWLDENRSALQGDAVSTPAANDRPAPPANPAPAPVTEPTPSAPETTPATEGTIQLERVPDLSADELLPTDALDNNE